VVIGDRGELVGHAVGDKRGHRNPGDLASGCVGAGPPVGFGDRLSPFRAGRRRRGGWVFGDRCLERVVGVDLISRKSLPPWRAVAEGTTAAPVPGNVAQSTRRRTWAGCRNARAWAIMPPIDQPSTFGLPRPRVSMSALVWSAMASMVTGAGSSCVRPTPELSNITTRLCRARA
jgi:hypothetical protein